MWIESISNKSIDIDIDIEKKLSIDKVNNFFCQMELTQEKVRYQLIQAKQVGKVVIWGAGAKGITFVNALDPDRQYIDYLVDINMKKQDKYCAGSGHIIKGKNWINKNETTTIFVMNSNYLTEIKNELTDYNVNFTCL